MRVVNMNTANVKQQKGFTLIELIIVIIILGILAVTAAPKFIDIQDEANDSATQGVLGAVKSGSQIARAQFLINSGATDLEDVTVAAVNGYLAAEEICEVVGLQTDDDTANSMTGADITGDNFTCAISSADVADTTGVTESDNVVTITNNGAATPANCVITYTEAAFESGVANLPPTITNDFTGC